MSNPNSYSLDMLRSTQIPALPSGATYLLTSLSDDNIEIPELAGIIERQPSIAARLISLANSAWSSPFSPITSLENACARLGFSVVRSTSIALAVANPFDTNRCPDFDSQRFWSSALLCADAMAWLTPRAASGQQLQVATARTAGLLHNLGLLLLADQLPNEVQEAIEMVRNGSAVSLLQALRLVIGLDQTDAGAFLSKAWGLPEPLTIAMSHYAEPDYKGHRWELACLVGVAASMVSAIQRKTPWSMPEADLDRLGLAQRDANKVFEQLSRQADKIRELAELLFSL